MKKRILSILLALALLCAVLPASALRASAETTSGTCGDNLTWSFDSVTGTLTIKGSGEMDDFVSYGDAAAPWNEVVESIKKIAIGNGVRSIGDSAFSWCTSLTSVTIPNSVTSIGGGAFYYCTSLTSVTIPNSVTSIGISAFYCTSLTSVTIPNSVTSIGEWAFAFCNSLKSVSIPKSVTSIGDGPFAGCESLTKITVASGNPNYSNDSSGVLFKKNKTELIQYPAGLSGSYTIPNSVTSIGDGAFYYCLSLTGVTIPNSVTSIGEEAFNSCTSLTSVTIPNSVTSIDHASFHGCAALTSVTIPNSVTNIDYSAFAYCTSLTSVTIPNSVTSIGGSAFSNCTSLTSVTIGSSVRSIGNSAFDWCEALTSVTIPDSVTSIGNAAFLYCTSLTSVAIPESVTSIGDDVFFCCSHDLVMYGVAGSTAETYANENNIPFVALVAPKITTQPKSATVAIGQKATFKVVATGSNLSYQWQYKRAGSTTYTNWSGKTDAVLTVTGGSNNNGCKYRCVVSNPVGSKTSNSATLTVTTVAKPVTTTQPKSVSLALGEVMTFTCAATGEGTLRYQWQYKRSGATSWSNWSGKTDPILNVTAGSNNNGCQYRCAVTNEGGTAYSDAATLTITSSHECPGAAFTDMPAQGTIEHTAIDWAVRAGVTNGTSSTTFSPSKTVTRGQVVTFLWRACGCPEPKSTQNPFTDVKTSDYFYKAVLWAVEQGITNGTSATKFSPNKTCTRAHILTFLYRQQGSPAVGSVTVPYTDVKAGEFYEKPMKWAYSNGIDKGVTSTTFCPNADCTRVSTVVFLYRAITGQGRLK